MKKVLASVLAGVMLLTLAACGGKDATSTPPANSEGGSGAGGTVSVDGATLDSLTLGEDYTDLEADLKFITHRTDIMDSVFVEYVQAFQKLYPGINITYEGITDYETDMVTRLSTPQWGDICMLPTAVPITEMADYFAPLGLQSALEGDYNFMDFKMFGGVVYGMPSTINVQGVLYNKAVFEQAGITQLPKTPDEYLAALQQIKDNTDAIPLYTNFAAGWTMTAWDAYIGGSATGDGGYMNIVLPHAANPFTDRGDETGPYAVYKVLYEAVARGLTEDDPTTTDWEGSKTMLNNGQIATMVLGSWSIVQMQEAGPNADDIGYMTFPITVDGKQYASSNPDYTYAINVNSSDEAKIAAMLYIKWLVDESNFDYDQGGVPVRIGHEYPATLAAFDGIELVGDKPALDGEADLFPNINNDSEVSINQDHRHVSDIVEAAITGNSTLEDILEDWNQRWTAAQERYGVTPE